VISLWQVRPRKTALALFLALGALSACGRGRGRSLEVMYVSAPQAFLRDRVAAVYSKVGNVKNGDRVDVIDREKRWVKVRTADGAEGWLEQRFLIPQQTYDAFHRHHTQRNESAHRTRSRERAPVSAAHRQQAASTGAWNG
jgi:SH3-like domain-containing protein